MKRILHSPELYIVNFFHNVSSYQCFAEHHVAWCWQWLNDSRFCVFNRFQNFLLFLNGRFSRTCYGGIVLFLLSIGIAWILIFTSWQMLLTFQGRFTLPKFNSFGKAINPKVALLLCFCKECVSLLIFKFKLELKSPIETLVRSSIWLVVTVLSSECRLT